MTREDALKMLKYNSKVIHHTIDGRTDPKEVEALDMAIKALEQTRWITVSERLPEEADCYAVTRKIGSDLIVDACFFDGTNTWYNDHRTNHERNYLTNIVAWMPLPEPYKVESEK